MKWATPLVCLLGALYGSTALADGPDKVACIDANEQAQVAYRASKWQDAKQQLTTCVHAACPTLVRSECTKMLADLGEKMPRFSFLVRDALGADVVGATVDIDGAHAPKAITGTTVELDPGEHTFRFEHPGFETIERKAIATEGTERRLDIVLPPLPAAVKTPTPPTVAHRSPNVPAWIATGVAGVALGTFGGFALAGYTTESSLASPTGCAPRCTNDDLANMNLYYRVADIALGVSVTAAVVATILFLVYHPTTSKSATSTPTIFAF